MFARTEEHGSGIGRKATAFALTLAVMAGVLFVAGQSSSTALTPQPGTVHQIRQEKDGSMSELTVQSNGPNRFGLGGISAKGVSWGGGPPRYQGCQDVTFTYHRYNNYKLVKTTIYRFKAKIRWCFGPGDHITHNSKNVPTIVKNAWFTDLAPTSEPVGTAKWSGYWHPYSSSRNGHSGYHLHVQHGWHQCIATKYGCNSTEYPWIDVRIFGDGIWAFDAGR